MSSRHRERSRSRHRDRDRDREKDRDKDRDRHRSKRDRSRHRRSKERKSKDRKRSKDRRSRSRSRSRSKERNKSKDRDGTLAMLDQMVGTTTTSTIRPAASLAGRVAQAALLAAQVAQKVEKPPDHIYSIGEDYSNLTAEERRMKKRRSRWAGSEHDKTFIPGMPTILPQTLTKEQEEQYLLQLQIEEVSRKLRSGDLGIPANPEERSPSPEPIYSSDGKRLNMREYRTRRKLEETRHALVQKILAMNPEFKPPSDYKPPIIRVHDKVMIPQEQHPDLNFVGLLIGPRGNTLKSMEKETGAKIIIRGKGSVKEGKVGRKDGQPLPGEDEPLHAYITATNPECVKKAVDKIKEVIRQGVEVPEGQNDLRRMQLRELAQLNGTLREGDARGRCSNCGATDHKSWTCPDKPNVTNNIVCSACGGAGHIAGDCRSKRPGQGGPPAPASRAKIDEEYLSLMAELGEGPPPDRPTAPVRRPFGTPFDVNRAPPRAIMAAPSIPNTLPPPPGGFTNPSAPPPSFAPPPPPPGAPPQVPWMQPPPPGSGPAPPPNPPNMNGQMSSLIAPPGFQSNQMMGMMNRGMAPPGMNINPPGNALTPPGTSIAPPGTTSIAPPGTSLAPPGTGMGPNISSGSPTSHNNIAPPGVSMCPPGMGPPPNQMGGPPNQMGGPPNQMGAPPNQMGGPPNQMGGPPNQMGGPLNQMGCPPNQMGGPPNMGGPMNQMGGPMNQMGGPMNQMGGSMNQMGGPPNQNNMQGQNQGEKPPSLMSFNMAPPGIGIPPPGMGNWRPPFPPPPPPSHWGGVPPPPLLSAPPPPPPPS